MCRSGEVQKSEKVQTPSLPTWIKPQLPKLVEKAPDGPDWLHELKLDGYRMHARLDTGRVQIVTRCGNHWTEKYPSIAKAIDGLSARNAYLDGELCEVLPDGRTAFNLSRPSRNQTGISNALCPRSYGLIWMICRFTSARIFPQRGCKHNEPNGFQPLRRVHDRIIRVLWPINFARKR
jgi:hypothetical protein